MLHSYAEAAVPEKEWRSIASGTPISDAALAAGLDVPEKTARRWRMSLESVGLLRCALVQPRRRKMELLNLDYSTEPQATAPARGLLN